MKKIFSFNKFFICFCIFFILIWVALQAVSYMRLKNMAEVDGERILAWNWPDRNTKSSIKIYQTQILKKDHNEAIIKVLADQAIEPIVEGRFSFAVIDNENRRPEELLAKADSKCAVTLTYYRTNNQWFLGKVECE